MNCFTCKKEIDDKNSFILQYGRKNDVFCIDCVNSSEGFYKRKNEEKVTLKSRK